MMNVRMFLSLWFLNFSSSRGSKILECAQGDMQQSLSLSSVYLTMSDVGNQINGA